MDYSINNLTKVADCEVLLTWAAREKADLDFQRFTDERSTAKFTRTSQEIDAALQGVLSELGALETVLATLPAGLVRDEAEDKKIRLEYKKFVLDNRREHYGIIALIQKESELVRVDREIVEVDTFIEALRAKKETLAA